MKRALLANVLPTAMQARVTEHLDRLKTYAGAREEIIALCQSSIDEADIGNVDNEGAGSETWEGWWLDETGGWREPEQMFSEEPGPDIEGLADIKCHVCGGMGHKARSRAAVKGERLWGKG